MTADHKELVQAFTAVLNHAFTGYCEELSHTKDTYHTGDTPCPEEQHLQRQAAIVQQFFKEYCSQVKRANKKPKKLVEDDTRTTTQIILDKIFTGEIR